MNFKKLIVTKINNIATEIRLNDPDVHNALTLDIINELSLCIDELSNDTSSLILISANGKSFCAGGDLSWMKKQLSAPRENRIKEAGHENVRQDDNINTLTKRVETYKNMTVPLVKYYTNQNKLSKLNGMDSIESISNKINSIITN